MMLRTETESWYDAGTFHLWEKSEVFISSSVQSFTTTAELNGHRASCPVANLGCFQKMNEAFNRTAGYSLLKNMDIIYISFILLINTCINLVNETNIKGAIAIALAPDIDCSQLKIIFPDLVLQILLLLSLSLYLLLFRPVSFCRFSCCASCK